MYFLLFMTVWMYIQSVECLDCYSCANVSSTKSCQTMTTCQHNEDCFTETQGSGNLKFQLGCRPHDTCLHNGIQSPAIVGRSVTSQSSCSSCCSLNGCNQELCAFENQLIHVKGPCEDDPSFDCRHIGSALNVCGDVQHAKLICRKYCGLCDIVDGAWTAWSNWSHCDVTCDEGHMTRTRTCTNPAPEHGGLDCVGPSIDKKSCYLKACPILGQDCVDVLNQLPNATNGVYKVQSPYTGNVTLVYCDMSTDGGGWSVFQKRFDGSVDFYKTFKEYEDGFGDVHAEFWMGLKRIYDMTIRYNNNELRIDLTAADGTTAYDTFQQFNLRAGPMYTLRIGQRAGTAGTGLDFNFNYGFSTKDRDVDGYGGSDCAKENHGGWWFNWCTYVNLNGEYVTPGTVVTRSYRSFGGRGGVFYSGFKGYESLKTTQMMFRRK